VKSMSTREKEVEDSIITEPRDRAHQPGNVNSGFGPRFMGSLGVGRDMNI
jgi:hypothetical protein